MMSSQILDFFRGKNVFISGTTGFLGKVVLEKIMRSIPDCGKIFLLVRQKVSTRSLIFSQKGISIMERVKTEVFESGCFGRLRKELPNFDDYVEQKVFPVIGDIVSQISYISRARKI